jgi:hypothetical protein
MNNKLIKTDTKIKEKIKDFEIKRDEQKKLLYSHITRLNELDSIEQVVKSNNEAYKAMLGGEQIKKEKENHQFRLNSIERQCQSSRERCEQHKQRILTLQNLEAEQQ